MHVNMALVLKFMAAYLFDPPEFEPVAERDEPPTTSSCSARARRAGWARSASTTGASPTTRSREVPNVARFVEQAEGLKALLADGAAVGGRRSRTSTSCSRSASCSR